MSRPTPIGPSVDTSINTTSKLNIGMLRRLSRLTPRGSLQQGADVREGASATDLRPLDRSKETQEAHDDPKAEAEQGEPRPGVEPTVEPVPACQTHDSRHDERDA